jgi:DNA-binding NarL/FixJ family response regulator
MEAPVRLALVDDHELFRVTLGSVLHDRGFEMVADGADARATFPAIDEGRAQVVLLDVALPGMDGITAAGELVARPASPKVLMLSGYETPHLVAAAFAAGAHGYALKSLSLDELVRGIRTVAEGRRYLAPGLSPLVDLAHGPLASLSPREREVFRMLVGGLTLREISTELCISYKTAETHRDRIYKKLAVHSAVQLVRFAVVNNLLFDRTVGDELDRRR